LAWEREKLVILVEAAPNWSTKYEKYEICTGGVSEDGKWRRLYPFPEDIVVRQEIHRWDVIEVESTKATDDPRQESRKIKLDSIRKVDRIEDKEERRKLIDRIVEPSLDIPIQEKRTMTLVRPVIEAFGIKKEAGEIVQITLNGKPFKRSPYGDVGLYYRWRCRKRCIYCKDRPHLMRCFDWGTNLLYTKYDNEKEARIKLKNKCYYEMKYDNDTWFALGTHSRRPYKRWMIVGLLWMKKESVT